MIPLVLRILLVVVSKKANKARATASEGLQRHLTFSARSALISRIEVSLDQLRRAIATTLIGTPQVPD